MGLAMSDDVWGTSGTPARSSGGPSDYSHSDVLALQQSIKKDQDDQLDALSFSIKRQTEIARGIGDEASEQLRLLDDIEDGVDRSTAKVDKESLRVRKFTVESSTKGLWVVICILFLGLIATVICAFSFK